MEELLTGIGTVDTSLFVQVRRDGLQIGEVQGGVPADLHPYGHENHAEPGPIVIGQPRDIRYTEYRDDFVHHAGTQWREDVLPN